MVEFVFVAITFLFVILGILQLGLVLNAYALTRYAAYNAARSAIVHGGNPDKMKDAARMSLLSVFPTHGRADHVKGLTENYLAAKATDDDANYYTYTVRVNGANQTKSEKITEVNILDNRGVGSGEVVTFDDPSQAPKGLITVQVSHRYELVVPLVNRILFFVYNRFVAQKDSGSGGYDNESLDNLSAETNKMRRSGGLSGEYRYPLVAHYTMRLQSDYEKP
jgi:Flp pilus assembly protein TadG